MTQYKSGIETKEKILEVCRKLFYEKGYEETTYKDIAAQVGIKDASIVYHFPKKYNIYDNIWQDAINVSYEEVRQYIKEKDNKEYLAFMFYYYILAYKTWKDEKYRRFISAAFDRTYNSPYDFYKDYFLRFNIIENFDDFMSENDLKIKSCYYMDLGFNKDVNRNFYYYKQKYTYKDMAKHSLLMYAKIFDIPQNLVDMAFDELEELLKIIKWNELYIGLNKN